MFASKDSLLTRPSGYTIARSVRTRSSATAYFNRTFSTPTLGTKWTWSGWVKRGTLSSAQTLFGGSSDVNNWGYVGFLAGDTLTFQQADAASVTSTVTTTQVFRDPAAWYHIVVAFDSTQATAANRLIMYVNGVQITAFGTATYLAQNTASRINQAVAHTIYRIPYSAANYVDGYLTEANFIDGQALTPSSFGSTNAITGVWQPAKYTGTYGTNGFYLNFSDNSNNTAATIGKDYSGNGNNWTPNNISVTADTTYDSMTDVPTLTSATAANYAVLNPLQIGSATTLTSANLNNDYSGTATDSMSFSSIAFDASSSNFYAEFTYVSSGLIGSGIPAVGICDVTTVGTGNITTAGTSVIYLDDGTKIVNGTNSSYGATWTTSDVIGVQINSGTVTFYKNGITQGSASTGLTGTYKFVIRGRSGISRTFTIAANFGQRPFSNLPSGAFALNTYNLPASIITNGAAYMAATLYTGTGASLTVANTVGSASFQPDWVWVKGRSGATDHALYDSVRGTTKDLVSNSTAAETTQTTGLTAFGSTGFTVGALAKMNTSSATYVAWQWIAGTTSASNTNGSITSTVSAGATQGFSVVTYTNTGSAGTVGHGLGVAPQMIIAKSKASVENWQVYHVSVGNTYNMYLNTTAAQTGPSSTYWNSTSPTSTVFSVSSWANADAHVAYCFSAVAGYSAFGSYTGNNSADGPFVYTGFRPRWILFKDSTNAATNWVLQDTSRFTYNLVAGGLLPNTSASEYSSGYDVDILSNGFKIRRSGGDTNASGATIIYAAFAENPFKNSLAR